jgi:hypothetical protein
MKKQEDPNTGINRFKRGLFARWSGEDYPGAEPRFYWQYLARDIAIFILLPIFAIIIYKFSESSKSKSGHPSQSQTQTAKEQYRGETSKSQIINFGTVNKGGSGTGVIGVRKRAPGTLVKLKLQNVVETYSTAPVHAQIVDAGLGPVLVGGSLIGDATPDSTFERITISFRFARDSSHEGVAFAISARALSLDGTLGLVASKKEGLTTRAVLGSASSGSQDLQGRNTSPDLKDILLRALTSGLFQEMGTSTQVEKNRSQVLTLAPGTEFFAELTDYFPGASK